MELNREQIVKALECCIKEWDCAFCPIGKLECASIKRGTLALIRELTEEVAKAKADTVRKMREMLNASAFVFASTNDGRKYFAVEIDTINQITKELLEESNGT